MYKKGELEISNPLCAGCKEEFMCPEWNEPGHNHDVHMYASDDDNLPNTDIVYLPHSCDEWIIGGIPEVKALIQDLAAALHKLRGAKP